MFFILNEVLVFICDSYTKSSQSKYIILTINCLVVAL